MYTTNNYIAVEPFYYNNNKKYKSAGKVFNKKYINNTGYLYNAPKTNKNPYNIIPSNYITTNNMNKAIIAIGNGGENKILYPNTGNFYFPNSSHVLEIPLYNTLFAQVGGNINKQQQDINTYPQVELSPVEVTADKPIWLKDKETKTPEKVKRWWNPLTWGKKIRKNDTLDYSDYTNYESAYKNANMTDKKNFMYKGHMYETETGDLTHGLSYRESKRFLKKYLNDSYPYDNNLSELYQIIDRKIPIYKNAKLKTGTDAEFTYNNETNEPIYIELSDKIKNSSNTYKATIYTHELGHKANKKRPKALDFIRNIFINNKNNKDKYTTDPDEILARLASIRAVDEMKKNNIIYTPELLRKWKTELKKRGSMHDMRNMGWLLKAYGDTDEGLDDLASLLNNNFQDFGYEGPYTEKYSFNYRESGDRKERRNRRQSLRRLARNMSNID